jgi:hypothetical protein
MGSSFVGGRLCCLWLLRNADERFVYLLPKRIDGISPQADGDRALTHGFRVEAS